MIAVQCPRGECGGVLDDEPNETNVLFCLLCARRFMRVFGEPVELAGRPPTPEDRRPGKGRD